MKRKEITSADGNLTIIVQDRGEIVFTVGEYANNGMSLQIAYDEMGKNRSESTLWVPVNSTQAYTKGDSSVMAEILNCLLTGNYIIESEWCYNLVVFPKGKSKNLHRYKVMHPIYFMSTDYAGTSYKDIVKQINPKADLVPSKGTDKISIVGAKSQHEGVLEVPKKKETATKIYHNLLLNRTNILDSCVDYSIVQLNNTTIGILAQDLLKIKVGYSGSYAPMFTVEPGTLYELLNSKENAELYRRLLYGDYVVRFKTHCILFLLAS